MPKSPRPRNSRTKVTTPGFVRVAPPDRPQAGLVRIDIPGGIRIEAESAADAVLAALALLAVEAGGC